MDVTTDWPNAKETFDEKLARVLAEPIQIVPYDPRWPEEFREEKERLLALLPQGLVRRIEHFGSTVVPGLAAKPVVDMLVEVTDLEATKTQVVPLLEARGYDYCWRPVSDVERLYYAWFIRRDPTTRKRTHHIHMVERDFPNWDSLLFRDYLIDHPDVAQQYLELKVQLASPFGNDRDAYTDAKGEFVNRVTQEAMRLYR